MTEPLKTPRKALMFERGRFLLAFNWAKSWSGWAEDYPEGRRRWFLFSLLYSTKDGHGLFSLIIWRLCIKLGIARKGVRAPAAHP